MKVQTISIIGLRRLGCSIALAIKEKLPDLKIYGHDRDREVMRQAKDMGAVDKTSFSMVNVAADGDIVILAVPLRESQETLKVIGGELREHAVLLDISPLKKPVQKSADEFQTKGHYVGLFPIMNIDQMADLRSGPEAAAADLFEKSVACLMPSPRVDEGAVKTAEQICHVLGTSPFYVDIEEFDIYAQALETLPGLLAAAYFRGLTGAAGWRDMRRMAGQPFAATSQPLGGEEHLAHMAFQNKAATLHWLDLMVENLLEMRRWVAEGDLETLGALLNELNFEREKWLHERRKNEWEEGPSTKVDTPGFVQQMLGSFGSRRPGRDAG